MAHRILLLYPEIASEAVDLLRREADVLGSYSSTDDFGEPLSRAHAIVADVRVQYTPALLDRAPVLRVIGRPGIGVDNVDLAAATERGICVVNTPDAPTEPVAEKVVGWILMFAHKLVQANHEARQLGWKHRGEMLGQDVVGKTLALIGVGRVGGRVAQICAGALQMRVLAYDPFVSAERASAFGIEMVSDYHDLLPAADFLSIHCPLTPQTRGMLGEAELRAMKPSAFLINSARSPVVVDEALVRALREKWIAGAALDVLPVEPPQEPHPLMALDNVFLAPHIGSFTREGLTRMSLGAAEQVLMVLRGERPPHLVNPDVWEKRR